MTHKLYNTQEEVKQWLALYNITNYTLKHDPKYGVTVCVHGDLDLSDRGIKELKVKFDFIEGNFNVKKNYLVSLYGSPERVDKSFDCSYNELTSLQYAPRTMTHFCCKRNRLTNLEYSPQKFESVDCSYNMITTLRHLPPITVLHIFASGNELTTLGDIRINCMAVVRLDNNKLEDLEGLESGVKYILTNNEKLAEYSSLSFSMDLDKIRAEFNTKKERKELLKCIEEKTVFSNINKI